MCFPERLTGSEKNKLFSEDLLWVGLSVTDAALLCVAESCALSDVLFLRLPRKSEIATGWEGGEEDRKERGVRGKQGEGGEGGGGGGGR